MAATISFGITFQVGRRHYWTCGFVGAVGWTIYIACTTLGGMTAPMATLIATLPLAALSRFFAIRHKAPITVFLLTGIFPLVPGAGIYYTAYYFLRNDRALCTSKGIETLKVAVALALGLTFSAHPAPSCFLSKHRIGLSAWLRTASPVSASSAQKA